MALVRDYFLKTKEWTKEYGPNTVVLMQVGAFFEVYGVLEDDGTYSGSRIADVAVICDLLIGNKPANGALPTDDEQCTIETDRQFGKSTDKTTDKTTNKQTGKKPVKMAGFRDHQLDKYLRRLNEAGWTCVVYTQDAATKNTTRSLMGVFSPGTFFSDETTAVSNNTMVVWLEQIGVNRTDMASLSSTLSTSTSSSTLKMKSKSFIGVAVADIFTGRTIVVEYNTDESHNPSSYDDLERTYSVYNPSEVIIVSSFSNEKIKQVIQYSGMNEDRVRIVDIGTENESFVNTAQENGMTRSAKKCEKQAYQMETINTFFGNRFDDNSTSLEALLYDMQMNVYGFQALVFLLNYIYAHNPNLASKLEIPTIQHHSDKLILANHSLKQLNMIGDDNSATSIHNKSKLSSVSSLLNSAVTAGGKRTFTSMLHNPICDTMKLKQHYDITDTCLDTGVWKTIRDNLKDVKDIEKLCRKLVLRRFTPRDVAILYDSLTKVKTLLESIRSNETTTDSQITSWENIRSYLKTACNVHVTELNFDGIIERISETIDVDEAVDIDSCSFNQYSAECVNKGTCFIKEDVSSELDDACKGGLIWKQQLASIIEYFDSLVAKTETSGKSKSKLVKLHETPTMPPTILLTKRRSAILKLELAKIMRKTASTDETMVILCKGTDAEFEFNLKDVTIENATSKSDDVISSSQIRDLTFNMRNSKDVFNERLSQVFKDFCHQLIEYNDDVTQIADFVRHMDVIQSRCYIAEKYGYCKPVIVCDDDNSHTKPSFVRANGLRHPLIEHIQTNEIYVTNDLSLGLSGDDVNDTTGILLFGTNAVGKTSIIKALGISVIMAQSGLYVPCSSFTFRPYNAIFTRILGNDNIHRGLSTFAVEMLELRTILKMANQNSLILGDELCSGTESDSALSIFATGIERLHSARSSFIFATHFHEIVDYDEIKALANLKAKHMTVIYNRELDLLIYDRKLKDGPGASMYGLEVCKALDLPQDFLERAHSLRSKYNRETAADTEMGTSHFNKRKVLGRCELCGKTGTEIHHLQHQKHADGHGRIKHFSKNHLANLISLCEACHDSFHQTDVQYERKKTTKGYRLFATTN